ncbi:hypothetical protein MCOR27_005757 [Pyricularia oryzae]|uniref:Peptidyl-tRNA hydrolase n=2 Tax=Pyricularia TaxID=48558 RepID=A0ABQ8NTZ8_PYRGI|nr:hypothetical protein MCOR01_006333 [Pyricularia oryzae]KAI6302109.1 hypothetical protein MCOR33_002568 [Pyricularia grisea]KAH9435667.1 hypothetical protein MCOR02_004589 [Pyricularia oryzae]KAI6259534.1 hypothetical protein MCOR19_004075 [Pyricularia oryzae]KAI6275896.1 hypothetical protein MCOR26_005871 [Pyricularia oryzae]
MRLSTPLLLALPVLGVSAEGAYEQYYAKFQNFLGQFGATPPSATPEADKAKSSDASTATGSQAPAKPIEVLTLDNWKDLLYGPVKSTSTEPEEWWVMITGGNKTCWGRCAMPEAAWNASAPKIAALPNSPHLGYLNCEANPVLCNVWSAGAPSIWSLKMKPAPSEVEIVIKPLSRNETTAQTIMDIYEEGFVKGNKDKWVLNDSVFHPFNGFFAKNSLSVPVAYVLWFFSVVPNWAVMLCVSFMSRSMMNRRMGVDQAGAGQAARRGAPPGDAR